MFDLLGYWGVISLFIWLLMAPIICLGYLTAISFVSNVVGSVRKGENIVREYLDLRDGLEVNGKQWLNEVGWGVSVVVGFLLQSGNLLVLVFRSEKGDDVSGGAVLIDMADKFGSFLSPYAGYVVLPVLIYFLALYSTKKAIVIKAKLDSISEKLKEIDE